MTRITICDVPATTRNTERVWQTGGEIARINDRYYGNPLMDVQYKDCSFSINKVGTIKIETSSDVILFFKEEYGYCYVQYID